jgi:hypothetical protein
VVDSQLPVSRYCEKQKSPVSFDTRLQAELACCLGLAGCWKRPGSLRVQSRLSRGAGRCSGCFGSGLFRGFLRSGLFRSFFCDRLLGSYFFGSSFFCWCFLGSSFLGRSGAFCSYFFRGSLFGSGFLSRSCFLGRSSFLSWRDFLCSYFFRWRFFGRSLFRYDFFRWGFLGRCFFRDRGFFRSSFFRRWFFRSCHSFLLDHVAKSTSRLEYEKRFTALGQPDEGRPAPRTR